MDSSKGALRFVAPVLVVEDLRRSLAYYGEQLGFAVEFEYEGFYASMVRDGCRVHFKAAPRVGRDQAAVESAEHIDVFFAAEDAQELHAALTDRGAVVTVALRDAPYGREFYVRDPDGYILGFIETRD